MKQCPNPNCILYTRLEELPDAYVKCPGCGGMLVTLDNQSGHMASGRLSNRPVPAPPAAVPRSGPGQPSGPSYLPPMQGQSRSTPPLLDDSDAYDPYAPLQQIPPGMQSDPYAGGYSDTSQHGASHASMSPAMSQAAYVSTSSLGTAKWTTASKVAFGLGSVLLLLACGLLGWIFSNRFFPESRVIASPQATETALALVRPPVNTPIMQPSITTIAGNFPGPTLVVPTRPMEPTALVIVPTEVPQVIVPPAQPPASSQPPPAQQEPVGGIIEAHMTSEPGNPTSDYGPNDAFSLAAQATFGPGNVTSVLTRWYGPDGAQIYAMQKEYSQPGVYYAAFTVHKNTPWLPGTYRVDIYANNSPAPSYSVLFNVVQ